MAAATVQIQDLLLPSVTFAPPLLVCVSSPQIPSFAAVHPLLLHSLGLLYFYLFFLLKTKGRGLQGLLLERKGRMEGGREGGGEREDGCSS